VEAFAGARPTAAAAAGSSDRATRRSARRRRELEVVTSRSIGRAQERL
jgi:hypothetical protein